MSVQVVGDTQILLQLFKEYIDRTYGLPTPLMFWQFVFRLVEYGTHPMFTVYRGRSLNREIPSPQFLGAIHELISDGFIKLNSGILSITPIGSCLAGARCLSPTMQTELETLVLSEYSESHSETSD